MNDASMPASEPPIAPWGAAAPAAPAAGGVAVPLPASGGPAFDHGHTYSQHGAPAAPQPPRRGARFRRSKRSAGTASAAESPKTHVPRQRRLGRSLLIGGVIVALIFVVPMVLSSFSGNSAGGSYAGSGNGSGSGSTSDSSGGSGSVLGGSGNYSSYYDKVISGNNYSARWSADSTFHNESGAYDGPYDYSGYGVDGMKARAHGSASDPLYADAGGLPDVFDQYGASSSDPLNGAPVTARGASSTVNSPGSPYYNPLATEAPNPYQNRLDMSFGQGASRSAWLDGTDLASGGF